MTDDFEWEIADVAPTDSEGHPVHPERGHRICGAVKSDRSTPAPHGRSRDDYPYCLQPAGWGTDERIGACRNHPYSGSQIGEQNPNFKHGKTSEYFRSKMSERQQEVYDEMVDSLDDPEDASKLLGLVGQRLILQGEHAENPAMIREGRQLLETFNIVPNSDQLELSGGLDNTTTHELDEDTKELARELIRRRQEEDAGDE